jgi:hypothetical protein
MPFFIGSLCINCLSCSLETGRGGKKAPAPCVLGAGALMTLVSYLSKRPTPLSNKDENKEVNEAHY